MLSIQETKKVLNIFVAQIFLELLAIIFDTFIIDHTVFIESLEKHVKLQVNTGWFKDCDTFDMPLRGIKFHLLMLINDSFCSWKVTKLTQNCNFDQNQ